MQKYAKLVIVGSGIVGASIAYHLTELGWTDILVIDKGPLRAAIAFIFDDIARRQIAQARFVFPNHDFPCIFGFT